MEESVTIPHILLKKHINKIFKKKDSESKKEA